MKKIISTIMMIIVIVNMMAVNVTAADSDPEVLKIEGVYHYDMAQEMLVLVNEERESLNLEPLSLDKELTDAAMLRAAECAVLFEHERPDGSSYFTVSDRIIGENIAAGSSTASGTFTQWKNSSGHYANMISSRYKCIGIGCFSIGSLYFWVQDFGTTSTVTAETRNGEEDVVEYINTLNAVEGMGFNLNMIKNEDGSRTLMVGETFELKVGRINAGWNRVYCSVSPDTFIWSSSDPSIASVDNKGNVTALSTGDAVITAKIADGSGEVSQTIKCRKDISADSITFDKIEDYTYSGGAIYPKPVVYDNGIKLTESVDYTLSYSSDVTNAGTHYVRITGIGDYTGTNSVDFKISRLDISDDVELEMYLDKTIGEMSWEDFLNENVNVYHNGNKLEYDKDYYFYTSSVSSTTDMITSFGISFTGNFTSSKYLSSLANAYVPEIATQYYYGKSVTPEFKVYENIYRYYYNSDPLKYGQDYNYTIINNNKAGTATINIYGIGDYYGSLEKTFTIKSVQLGDVDRNEKVNMKDLALLQQYMNGWQVSVDTYASDLNGDGKINMKDYAVLQQVLNSWTVELG